MFVLLLSDGEDSVGLFERCVQDRELTLAEAVDAELLDQIARGCGVLL